jgi:hypothetical protein
MSMRNPSGSARVSRAGERVLAVANFAFGSLFIASIRIPRKDRLGATPKVRAGLAFAREMRALPNRAIAQH